MTTMIEFDAFSVRAGELMQVLRVTHRCLSHMRPVAVHFSDLATAEWNAVFVHLCEQQAAHSISVLLCICAIQRRTLDPAIIFPRAEYIERGDDFILTCQQQTADAIPYIIRAVAQKKLRHNQRAVMMLAAVKMACRSRQFLEETDQALRRLIVSLPKNIYKDRAMLQQALFVVEDGGDELDEMSYPFVLASGTIEELIPEERPAIKVSSGLTAHRSANKIGRNDPCHCGSGKKYKKCCQSTDQQQEQSFDLEDESRKAHQLERGPAKGSLDYMHRATSFQLEALDFEGLDSFHLMQAIFYIIEMGLWERALDLLILCEKKFPNVGDELSILCNKLLIRACNAGNIDVPRRLREHFGPRSACFESLYDAAVLLSEHPVCFEQLDQFCRRQLIWEEELKDDPDAFAPLTKLIESMMPDYPALFIMLARTSIISVPDEDFESAILLGKMDEARLLLHQQGAEEPAEDVFEYFLKKQVNEYSDEWHSRELTELKEHYSANRDALKKANQDMMRLEGELKQAQKKRQKKVQQVELPDLVEPSVQEEPQREVLERLRSKIRSLKAEVTDQQRRRANLREELLSERDKKPRKEQPIIERETSDSCDLPHLEKVPIPEYSKAFREHCSELDASLVAKALQAVSGFATRDPATLHQSKKLEQRANTYRVRIGIHYRLLLETTPDASALHVLALIPRADLESWLRRKAG